MAHTDKRAVELSTPNKPDDKPTGEQDIEENNMGNMSKAEAMDFFAFVIDDLGVVLSLGFTPNSPSIYLGGRILFSERDLNGYKWQVKERLLHEIAHHFEVGKRRHGTNFYKVYAELVSKYLAGYRSPSEIRAIERDAMEGVANDLLAHFKKRWQYLQQKGATRIAQSDRIQLGGKIKALQEVIDKLQALKSELLEGK